MMAYITRGNKTIMKNKSNNNNVSVQKRNTLIQQVQDSSFTDSEKDYLKTLLYPDQFSSRPTDIVSQPTTLYRSVREFALTVNLNSTVDSGRFSFAIQPKLGGTDQLNHYQCAIVDSSTGWPQQIDFSNHLSYQSSNFGVDPRVDPNVPTLTFPPIGNISLNANSYSGDQVHFNMMTIPSIVANSSFNMQTNFVTMPVDLVTPLGVEIYAHAPYNYGLWLPCGVYAFSQYTENQGTFAGGLNYSAGFILTNKAGTVVRGVWYRGTAGTEQTGICLDQSFCFINHDHSGTIHNVNQGLINVVQTVISFDDDMLYVPIFLGPAQNTNQIALRLTIEPAMTQYGDTASNCGNISKLRPIAMSCLLTNTAPDLLSGGDVVAYSAPPGVIAKDYFASTSSMGSYQRWEDLARNNKGILTYDGKFRDGAYTFYQPYDTNDLLLRDPVAANDYDYPGLIVSGQYNPGNGSFGVVEVARIRVIILFEYITDNPVFEAESQLGSSYSIEKILTCVSTFPHSMENKIHMKKIAEMFKSAAKWTVTNAATMHKAINMATGLARLMV